MIIAFALMLSLLTIFIVDYHLSTSRRTRQNRRERLRRKWDRVMFRLTSSRTGPLVMAALFLAVCLICFAVAGCGSEPIQHLHCVPAPACACPIDSAYADTIPAEYYYQKPYGILHL